MLSESKVDDDRLVVRKEDVGRLEIVVSASVRMEKVDGGNQLCEVDFGDRFGNFHGDQAVVLRHCDDGVSGSDDEGVESDNVGMRFDSRNRSNSLEFGPERLDTSGSGRILRSVYQFDSDLVNGRKCQQIC